jgi:hypothetical protein
MIDHTKIINSLSPSVMQHGLPDKPSQDEEPDYVFVYRDHPKHGMWQQAGVILPDSGVTIWCYSHHAAQQLRQTLLLTRDH